MPVPEAEVLKPVDPSISNSDDWEIFVLNDAQVVYESNGKPASLLIAYADTPLKVTGWLEAPRRDQSKCFLKKSTKPQEIEIRNVTRFSYGEMTDYTYVIWAQGQAGWFEIRPAQNYVNIYEDMVRAVELLYFVTDIYNEPRKRGGGPSAQLVFQEVSTCIAVRLELHELDRATSNFVDTAKYVEDDRYACDETASAEKLFERHHVFLIMSFIARAQGIGWSNTPLYQYFRRKYPKDFEACKARMEGKSSQVQAERQTRTTKSTSIAASEAKSTRGTLEGRGGRGRPPVPKTTTAPKKDDNWWEAAALFEFMQKAVNQRVVRAGRNQITLERVAELVVKRYEIEELDMAKNVLLVHAQNLCYMMDHPRRQNVKFFASEPIYQTLAAGHDLSAAEQRRAEGTELRPRKDHATLRDGESDSSDVSDLEDDLSTPIRPPQRRKRGRLSVLRPTSGKFSGKRQGKGMKNGKGKAPMPESEDDSEEQGNEERSSSEDEMSIDTPTQALSPGRDKRKLEDIDPDERGAGDRRKRAASASETPESTSSLGSEDEDEQPAAGGPPLPLRHKLTNGARSSANNTKPAMAMPLVSTPLPTYESNGPRDSWICSFDGCSQRIYGCSKELGRQLITEHLEDHSKGREKFVGILWREQDKLHLPVSNLIKKIREMSDSSTPLFPSTTAMPPRPIQRPV